MGHFFPLRFSFLNGWWHVSQQHLQTKDDKFPFILHEWYCVRCCTKFKLGAPEAQKFYSYSKVERP